MIEHSPELDKLAAALVKVQATVEGAKKDSLNPHFKSRYADLESVWDACRKPLTDNGFSVSQWPGETTEHGATLTTFLLHTSGQWMKETSTAPLSTANAQGYGSVITYLKRYALQGVAGVAPVDDDGNAASERSEHRTAGESPVAHPSAGSSASAKRTEPGPSVSLTSLVTWGKHKGKTVKEVGPDYFEWLLGEARSKNQLDTPSAKFAAGAIKALMPDMTTLPKALEDDDEDRAFDKRLAAAEAK